MTVACRSCGAPIWWAWTTSGKRMPVDATPREDGNLVAVDEAGAVLDVDLLDEAIRGGQSSIAWVARRAHRSMSGDVPRWVSHFVTCPQGPRWRRNLKKQMSGGL